MLWTSDQKKKIQTLVNNVRGRLAKIRNRRLEILKAHEKRKNAYAEKEILEKILKM